VIGWLCVAKGAESFRYRGMFFEIAIGNWLQATSFWLLAI